MFNKKSASITGLYDELGIKAASFQEIIHINKTNVSSGASFFFLHNFIWGSK